jgi:hypothetical protein
VLLGLEKPLLVDALASNVEKNIQFTKFIPARGQPSDDLRAQFRGLLATTCCAALLTSNGLLRKRHHDWSLIFP